MNNSWEKNRKTFFDFLSSGLGINVSLFRLGQFEEFGAGLGLPNRVTENMVIFESGLPRGRNDTISITDDNPKIWWQSNEVYSWPQPPLISHRKCTGRILASAASYLL